MQDLYLPLLFTLSKLFGKEKPSNSQLNIEVIGKENEKKL